MKYFTKEWYALMQQQFYTDGMQSIPDKHYSDREIRDFYARDLQEEIERDRKLHDTPPKQGAWEELLQPDQFRPDIFLLEDEHGTLFHPETPEIARVWLEKAQKEAQAVFDARPPYDPDETIQCFRDCYRAGIRYAHHRYPRWVHETVDRRLLALNRMPESVLLRLREEEFQNRQAFEQINREASMVLDAQDIPDAIRKGFCFHDADLLRLRRTGRDLALILRNDRGFPDRTPYEKVVFRNISRMEREPGFVIRARQDHHGNWTSGCQYLYEELYRTDTGYEIRILLWTRKSLRYLTIWCEDILLENNIILE